MKKVILSLLLITSITSVFGQDPEFTQFYANPLYLNPAFAGANRCPRIIMNYRNQWPNITGTFVTTSVSFDKYQCKVGGIGFFATNDLAGRGTIRTSNYSALYAYHLPLNRFWSFSAGFQATYAEKKLDWSKLTFGDMIDPRRGFVYTTNETQGDNVARYFDASAGIMVYSAKFFAGFAANHLAEPDEHLLNGPSPLPRKYTVHAGANIRAGSSRDGVSISPNVLFQQQQDFSQLNMGLYFTKGPMTGGLWYRNADAFIVLVGVQHGMFKMGYSYDVTVSKLSNATAGSHEVSFQMQFTCKKCKRAMRPPSCPSF